MATKDSELLEFWKKTNEALQVARKFHEYVGNLGNVVNKTELYNKGMGQPGSAFGTEMVKVFVDYVAKIEQILTEMRTLFTEAEQVTAPKSTRCPVVNTYTM